MTFNRTVIVDRDDWIAVDIEATRLLYRTLGRPLSEDCPCAECRAFTAHRDLLLPDAFLDLLARMGVDPSNEGELWAVAGPSDLYVSAAFDFVGEVVPSSRRLVPDVHDRFEYVFKNVASLRTLNIARELRLGPVASVRFGTTIAVTVHPAELVVEKEWALSP